MGAVLAFDGRCRLLLERTLLSPGLRTAVWLLCNPSTADAQQDDPTVRRMRHFTLRAGCGRMLVGNVWPLRTPYPAELWAALARGDLTDAMRSANLDALAAMAAQADALFVAFGAEPWRRHRPAVEEAVRVMLAAAPDWIVPDCLGITPDGAPLHPLARGKFAVRNDCEIFEWPGVLGL